MSKQGSDKDTKNKKFGNEMSIKVTEELQYTLGDLGGLCACPGKTWRDPNISNITDLEDLHSKKWDLRQSCKLLEYYRHAHTQIHTQSLLANSERFLRNSLPNHLLITNLTEQIPQWTQETKKIDLYNYLNRSPDKQQKQPQTK